MNGVVILKIFPGMSKTVFESIIDIPELRGIVLESFGAGNVPTTSWMTDLIKKATQKKNHCFEHHAMPGWSRKYGTIRDQRETAGNGCCEWERHDLGSGCNETDVFCWGKI